MILPVGCIAGYSLSPNTIPMNIQLPENRFAEQCKKLAAFLNKYGRYPRKSDCPELYAWVVSIRISYKKGLLDAESAERLNAIGFIWSMKEWRWFNKAMELKQLLMNKKIILSVKEYKELYDWLLDGQDRLRNNLLTGKEKSIIEEINRLLNDRQSMEAKKHIRRTAKKPGIAFNFNNTHPDRWKEKWQTLNEYLLCHQELPGRKSDLYIWARDKYFHYFDLSPEKQELLNSINFLQYFMYQS
jgi:hypothetical protein